jgi:hypothetical protein
MALEETWSIERMDKEGLCILPPSRVERPTLGDFTAKDVDLALHNVPFFRENRLLKLLELKKATPEYLAPVTVVVLHDRKQQEQRFAVYRNGALQRGESAVLQRHSPRDGWRFPYHCHRRWHTWCRAWQTMKQCGIGFRPNSPIPKHDGAIQLTATNGPSLRSDALILKRSYGEITRKANV